MAGLDVETAAHELRVVFHVVRVAADPVKGPVADHRAAAVPGANGVHARLGAQELLVRVPDLAAGF